MVSILPFDANTAGKPNGRRGRAKHLNLLNLHGAVASGNDRRRDLTQIQWFVVITSGYLLVVQDNRLAQDPLSLLLLAGPLLSMLIFLRLPDAVIMHRSFPQIMALVDTILICTALIVNRESPWDLFLLFFFGVLVAAIGENFLQIIGGCLLVGVLSIVIIPVSTGASFSLDSNMLLRIPLLLGSSLLYGYLADQVKREKRKAAELEQSRRQQLLTKDQFFSNVSHELRTPLTAVYQFVTIVLDGLGGKITSEQKEYLEIALRNVRQLQAMVGDLLEAARAESGKLAIHPRAVSLNLSVEEALGTFSANTRQKGVQLRQDLPGDLPLLYVDPRRLKQILTNLIDNALKFTPKGGSITVRAGVFAEDRDFIRVSVSDTGCGLSPSDAERIFDRLYQVDNSFDTNRNGLGLGLHITKELVVRHGGRIWAEGKPGEGATFHFIVPVFSLKRLLESLLQTDGQSINTLSLISVELLPDPSSPVEVAKAIQEMTWLSLNAMELPQRAALFPNIVLGDNRCLFYILQAKDLESSTELAMRIETEIGRSKQFRNARCRVRTIVTPVDLPQTAEGLDIEELAAQIDAQISQAIAINGNGDQPAPACALKPNRYVAVG
jgi:signal transduction histidine kinase